MLTWLPVLALMLAAIPRSADAHGTLVESSLTRRVQVELEVEVHATYHSGRPMAGASVRVMAPGDDQTPYLVGTCDDDGRFVFQPPADRVGTWEVQVRLQGHGGTVQLDVEPPADGAGAGAEAPATVRVEASSSPHLSAMQIVVMVGCVVWGLVGTALFFTRRRA
jgi:nickel transport protein